MVWSIRILCFLFIFYPFNRQSASNPALQAATLYGKRLPGGNKRCRNAFFSAKAVAPVQAFSYKVNQYPQINAMP